MGLPGSEDSLTIGWAVSTQYQRVSDRQTDRRPAYSYNVRSMTDARLKRSFQTLYTEWPWDILEVTWFFGWKVKSQKSMSISAFFISQR